MAQTLFDNTISETEIREAAYYIWKNEGQPAGQDGQHWQRAIDALKTGDVQEKPAKKAAKAPRKAKAAPKAAAKPKAEVKAKAPAKAATKTAAKKPAAKRATKAAKA